MSTPTTAMASTTASIAPSTAAPTAIFITPALTTSFTPPPSCTQNRLTMLESDAYRIWMNEPYPVPNTTVSDCYPTEVVSSYLEMRHGTVLPAFSPLVCPDNYHTVFSQDIPNRPLYVACCPKDFMLAYPSTSTPGRPAYGGTCYSNIMTVHVTQYDNSSSSGVMLFEPSATTNQAYAHPIDGFAMDAVTSAPVSGAAATSDPLATNAYTPHLPAGAVAGIVVGCVIFAVLAAGAVFFYCRGRKLQRLRDESDQQAWQQHQLGGAIRYGYMDDKFPPPPPRAAFLAAHAKPSEVGNDFSWVSELPQRNPPPPPPPQELDANQTPRRAGSKSSSSVDGSMAMRQKRASASLTGHWPAVPGGPRSMDAVPSKQRGSGGVAIKVKRPSMRRQGSKAESDWSRRSVVSEGSGGVLFSPATEESSDRWDTGSPVSPAGSLKMPGGSTYGKG